MSIKHTISTLGLANLPTWAESHTKKAMHYFSNVKNKVMEVQILPDHLSAEFTSNKLLSVAIFSQVLVKGHNKQPAAMKIVEKAGIGLVQYTTTTIIQGLSKDILDSIYSGDNKHIETAKWLASWYAGLAGGNSAGEIAHNNFIRTLESSLKNVNKVTDAAQKVIYGVVNLCLDTLAVPFVATYSLFKASAANAEEIHEQAGYVDENVYIDEIEECSSLNIEPTNDYDY